MSPTPTERNSTPQALAARATYSTSPAGYRAGGNVTGRMMLVGTFTPFLGSVVDAEIQEYLSLVERYKAVVAEANGVATERRAAEQADEAALIDAMRRGKSDPGQKNFEAWKAKNDAVIRRQHGTSQALVQAYFAMIGALDEHSDVLVDEFTAAAADARKDLDTALAAAEDAAARIDAADKRVRVIERAAKREVIKPVTGIARPILHDGPIAVTASALFKAVSNAYAPKEA